MFKVVFDLGGKLVSARQVSHAVEYKVGEWAEPVIRDSKLFVFSDLEEARRFQDRYEKIFTCEVENTKPANMICQFPDDFLLYWAGGNTSKMPAPKSTYFADRVKLIEEIK